MTTKYKVIVVRTQFMIKEVEANSKEEATDLAWETDPMTWENHYLSTECEQYDTLPEDDNEYQYF